MRFLNACSGVYCYPALATKSLSQGRGTELLWLVWKEQRQEQLQIPPLRYGKTSHWESGR